jgi:cellulose synthase/poly-beta-1,6-N-acetylglucosamine synthase-like glycosyltransferase
VQSLLRQRYPHFYIYLVADECPADFDPGIQDAKLTVFQPDPPLRLKVKSIIYAMERLVRSHDYIAVFDADNLAHPDFLTVIDQYAAAGHHSIQGQRTAKNTDNAFAAADSVGELYKNYIERYAPWLLGSSAVISGSGMAVETGLYQAYLQSPAIQEGQHLGKRMLQEDKILQNFLLLRGESIAFAQKAVCYDEKIQNADAVQTQRSRWLFSYFQNLPNTLRILISGIIHLDWNRFFFGLVTLSLPMFIQVGLAFLLFILGWFVAPVWSVALTAAVTVFAFTVLWTLSLSGAPGLVRRAFIAIPTFIWRQMRALLGMRNPDKNFKHTEHTKVVTVDEVLGGEE